MIEAARKTILSTLISIIFCLSVFSQGRNLVIQEIAVFGNSRMKASAIKRVMRLREGQAFEQDMIQNSQKRLERLGVFKHVSIEKKSGKHGVILIVTVKEKALFFINPVINIGGKTDFNFNEEEEKSFYGAEIGVNDFSGRSHHLSLEAGIGKLKKIGLRYENDYFTDLFWGLGLTNLWYKSKIYESDVEKQVASLFVGKTLAKFEALLWARYDRIKYEIHPSLDDVDKFYKIGINITYNSKDWDIFPSQGFISKMGAYKALNPRGTSIYDRYMFEFSSYHNVIRKHVLALNVNAVVSSGDVPLSDRLYFGGYKTLRGVPIGTYSGNNSVVFSSEYRMPLTRFNQNQPREGMQGTSVYLFLDVGAITERVRDLRLKGFRANSGLGFFWILSPEGGLRIDLSFQPEVRVSVSSLWKF